MCSCTSVGLHTLYCLLQVKCGVMHHQFAIDAQHCTQKVQDAKKARGWGATLPSQRTHVRDEVHMLCRTGSARCSSAPNVRSTRSKGGGTGGRRHGGHLIPHLKIQDVLAQERQGAEAARACSEAHQDWRVPLPLLWACPRQRALPFHQLSFGGTLLEGEADDQARQHQHPPQQR